MKKILVTVVLMSFCLSSCTMARIYATSGNTVALTNLNKQPAESFTATKRITFDYSNAIDVQEVLREKFGSGKTAQNVSLKLKSTFTDFLINLFTLGIAQSKTFEITGDIAR